MLFKVFFLLCMLCQSQTVIGAKCDSHFWDQAKTDLLRKFACYQTAIIGSNCNLFMRWNSENYLNFIFLWWAWDKDLRFVPGLNSDVHGLILVSKCRSVWVRSHFETVTKFYVIHLVVDPETCEGLGMSAFKTSHKLHK